MCSIQSTFRMFCFLRARCLWSSFPLLMLRICDVFLNLNFTIPTLLLPRSRQKAHLWIEQHIIFVYFIATIIRAMQLVQNVFQHVLHSLAKLAALDVVAITLPSSMEILQTLVSRSCLQRFGSSLLPIKPNTFCSITQDSVFIVRGFVRNDLAHARAFLDIPFISHSPEVGHDGVTH